MGISWQVQDGPDQRGRVAVVTGANGGLGLETARALAGAGAHVVMAARNQAKAADARADIVASHPGASLEIVEIDLGSLASVRKAADEILARHPAVDVLVNNAGVMAMPEGRTADGFETHLGVNHLGHWALTAHLLPALLQADAARVVTVTSTARHLAPSLSARNPHLEGTYHPWRAYGQSKKANYHFALGLDQRFRAAGVQARSVAAHPGLTNSDLQATTAAAGGAGRAGAFFHAFAVRVGMSSGWGALSQVRAAVDAPVGSLYGPRFVIAGFPVRLPVVRHPMLQHEIDTLWMVSERETGIPLDVPRATAR